MIEMRKGILETKTVWIKNATHLKNSPFQYQFVLFVLMLIAMSPFILLFIVYQLIRLCIILLMKAASSSGYENTIGYFVKLPHTSSQIIVNTVGLRRAKDSADQVEKTISFETVVSHEHIHMLQACYFSERVKYEDETDRVNFLKTLLKDPENDFRFISYFFKIDEMEARLHEVILSYYRNQGELPLDEKGFIKLLIGCQK